ncbi:MAG: 30S ribosome-binding factor RbfA [Deltaproteobacteria bacterium]|nr:30S ribosome-binding factor RbfA [Deltaproteobacteria bacterium]
MKRYKTEDQSSKRLDRISEAYQKGISQILHDQIRDPRLEGVFVTNVVITPDLRLAKVYFDMRGGALRADEAIRGFEKSKGFLKRELANVVRIKYMPDLKFYYDESLDVQRKIDELFEKIESEEESTDEESQEN